MCAAGLFSYSSRKLFHPFLPLLKTATCDCIWPPFLPSLLLQWKNCSSVWILSPQSHQMLPPRASLQEHSSISTLIKPPTASQDLRHPYANSLFPCQQNLFLKTCAPSQPIFSYVLVSPWPTWLHIPTETTHVKFLFQPPQPASSSVPSLDRFSSCP